MLSREKEASIKAVVFELRDSAGDIMSKCNLKDQERAIALSCFISMLEEEIIDHLKYTISE